MNAKVIAVRANDASKIAGELESALNEFLKKNPTAQIQRTHMNTLDIGGPSQADVLVLYTIVYTV